MTALSKMQSSFHRFGRLCTRGAAVVAIVAGFGVGQVATVVGVSGVFMTASSQPAQAWWRRGWGYRRGWGWRRGWRRGW